MILMLAIRLAFIGRLSALIVWTRKGQRYTPWRDRWRYTGPATSIIAQFGIVDHRKFESFASLARKYPRRDTPAS